MESKAIITDHAKERLMERLGIPKPKTLVRMVNRALNKGISHSQTKGNVNKWVTSLYFRKRTANNIKLYGDKAYLFSNDVLITILQIPHHLIVELYNHK